MARARAQAPCLSNWTHPSASATATLDVASATTTLDVASATTTLDVASATATLCVAGSQGLVATGYVATTGYWVAVRSCCWSTATDLVALVGLEGGSDTHQWCQAATGGLLATLYVATVTLNVPTTLDVAAATLDVAVIQHVTMACRLVTWRIAGARGG